MSQVPASWFALPTPDRGRHLHERHPRRDPVSPDAVCADIEALHAQTNDRVPPPPAPDSELADDDRALDPYHLSHALVIAVGIAADHLEAFRALLVEAQRTHPWAHHTLLRSAVENAATAVWLAGPDDPVERRFRRLRLAANDAWESGEARKVHGLTPKSGRSTDEIRQGIRALAPDDRNPLAGRFSYRAVLRDAAPFTPFEPDLLETLWRVESGLAHGRTWASFAMLDREERPGDEAGLMQVRMTVSVESLMPSAATAVSLVRIAEALRTRRSAPRGND